MEELEKLETEETAKIEGTSRSLDEGLSVVEYKFIDIMGRYHTSL